MEVFMNCVSFFIAHVCEVLENSFIFLYQVYTKIKIPLRISTKALIYQNVDHVVAVCLCLRGPSMVGTPGISHSERIVTNKPNVLNVLLRK